MTTSASESATCARGTPPSDTACCSHTLFTTANAKLSSTARFTRSEMNSSSSFTL